MVTYRQSTDLIDISMVFEYTKDLEKFYPEFKDWYINKIMPDILIGNGTLLIAEENKKIIGTLIGKKGIYPKLRCMKISTDYQNKAIGKKLIDQMLVELNCQKPSLTVPEENFHLYSRLLINHYKFTLDSVEKNMYRFGKLEYIFNDPKNFEKSHKTPYGLY